MKQLLVFLLLLHTSFFSFSQKSEKEVKALRYLKKYSPTGYYIVSKTLNSPGKFKFGTWRYYLGGPPRYGSYINGKTTPRIVSSLGTVVHEMTHVYTSRLPYKILQDNQQEPKPKEKYMVIHLKGDENVLIKQTETFPSRKLTEVIPEQLRTFRFNTYIKTINPILGTQQSGVYGLLDEFSAYYHDCQTSYELYGYYMNETQKSPQDYIDYVSDINSTFYAYAEFKHYILTYLIHAQSQYTSIYQDIMANDPFKKAFLATEVQFAQLIQDHFTRNEEITETLREQGITVRFEGEFMWIGDTGTSSFMEEYNLLMKEMEKPKYLEMMEKLKQ